MVQRRLRLRRPQDFERLRHTGNVQRHPFVVMSYTSNTFPHNRYGFITSKHLGNAVVRNRVRRLLRESVRHRHLDIQSGFDIVFIARPKIVAQPAMVIERTVSELLRRAGLLMLEEEL
ncbi:MAG: ribonuclease P protein component [Aggregatilineales bacterium]